MKLYRHIFYTFFALSNLVLNLNAQNTLREDYWKNYRKEIILQVGTAGFLGDLGGLNKAGSNYSPADVEFKLLKPAITVGYRYKFTKNINWHSSFNYLSVAGDDKLTSEIYRNNRNLNFKSTIFELATRLELSLFSNKVGKRYSIYKTLGSTRKTFLHELIGFVGIGGFYFNPKGKNSITGEWMNLAPLHTEGQGLEGGPKQYKKVSISIPIGMAYRVILSHDLCLGLEVNYRKTFTDYIDDVSTVYYNKNALYQAYGSNSVIMSDPSLGLIPNATAPDGSGMGAQRGDKSKDSYFTVQITIGYFIKSNKGSTRLRSKF